MSSRSRLGPGWASYSDSNGPTLTSSQGGSPFAMLWCEPALPGNSLSRRRVEDGGASSFALAPLWRSQRIAHGNSGAGLRPAPVGQMTI